MDDHPSCTGFGPAAFDWLDQLAADNSRAFFASSRAVYDPELREPLAALLAGWARDHGGRARVFRQIRDLRFAANQAQPYWPTVAGEVTDLPGSGAAVVVDVSPAGLTVLVGRRRPFTRDQLTRYRAAVDDDHAGTLLAAVADELAAAGAAIHGATLRGTPRGFPRAHPRAGLLQHTALCAGLTLAPRVRRRGRRSIDPLVAEAHVSATWALAAPLTRWLDAHVGLAEDGAAALAA